MSNTQKVIVGLAVFLVPLFMLFGFNALIVQPLLVSQDTSVDAEAIGVTRFNSPVEMNQTLTVKGTTSNTGAQTNAGLLNANGGIAVDTSAFTVADATGNTVVAGTLSIEGAEFTGPIKYGTAATYANGASITHGFVTTPTICIVQPTRDVTSTVTITTTGFSSDMATVATPIYWICAK